MKWVAIVMVLLAAPAAPIAAQRRAPRPPASAPAKRPAPAPAPATAVPAGTPAGAPGSGGTGTAAATSNRGAADASPARELSAGWGALASGRVAEAEAAADRLLQAGTRRHDATALKIAARVQAGRAEGALDQYEDWLKGTQHEDLFLLQPVAAGVLEAQATAADLGIRVDALQALAEAGDRTAGARLAAVSAAGGVRGLADEGLARAGDPQAIGRLTRLVSTAGGRADVSGAIETLAAVKPPGAATAIAAALDPARAMPTKLAAARALGALGSPDAVPALRKALQDPDPPVRMAAAAALTRLGDPAGADLIREMENSPVTDIRLMAAEASAAGNPSGAWAATATTALQDADPAVRLTAARLLIAHGADPTAALAALNQAVSDGNPALRLMAVRTLEQVPVDRLANDLPSLRRLLRDSDPHVRIAAASALLRLAGGVA